MPVSSLSHDADVVALRAGEFFGRRQHRRIAGAFSLAELTPTVPEREVREHAHEDAHFVLLRAGAYVSSAAGAPAVAAMPMLVYNPPGTVHRDRFRGEGGRFFALSCDAELLAHVEADGGSQRLQTQGARVMPHDALALAQRVRRECADWDAASPILAESLALQLLAFTLPGSSPVPDGTPSWLRDARELIEDRWGEDVGVREIARCVGVHPVHLARRFRERFGVGPGDYLRATRVARAADLLRRSSLPIGDIALRCGFGDASQFSKAFLRLRGVSPRAYRAAAG